MSEVTEFDSDDEIADLQRQLNAATVAPTMRKLFVVVSTKKDNKSKKKSEKDKKMLEKKTKELEEKDKELEEKDKMLEEKTKMLEEKTKEHKDHKEGTCIRLGLL